MPRAILPSAPVRPPSASATAGGVWAVLLAGGEGRRLAPLTTALYGEPRPKQFATLLGDRSLLQATAERVRDLVPAARCVTVVPEAHAPLARAQLERVLPGSHVLAQPRNLDTGPGLLLPLAWILARDPAATVAFFPSDHHVPRPAPFLEAAAEAVADARRRAPWISLLGVQPEGPETEYGWIVPGARLGAGRAHRVDRFVEKPELAVAERLHASGGLVNAFVLVGRGAALWSLAERHLPEPAARIGDLFRGRGAEPRADEMRSVYAELQATNFSREVLERASNLAVLPIADSGWCDWGSPARVLESLRGTRDLDALLARIEGRPRWSPLGPRSAPVLAAAGPTLV